MLVSGIPISGAGTKNKRGPIPFFLALYEGNGESVGEPWA